MNLFFKIPLFGLFLSLGVAVFGTNLIAAQSGSAAAETEFIRFKNHWKGTYLNIEHGTVASSDIHTGAWSSQWQFEPVVGTEFIRIKNRWKGTYLNIEKGPLVSSEIHAGAWSSQWKFEPVAGTEFNRIKNRWKGTYLNIENGPLVASEIHAGAWSSQWQFEPIRVAQSQTSTSTANPKPKAVVLADNDVSILFPPPITKADMGNMISMGDLGDAWSDKAFGNLEALSTGLAGSVGGQQIRFNNAFKGKKSSWHIAGIRIDPSAPGGSDEIRKQFGTSPQIRLILNPVTGIDSNTPKVHDFAVHLIYSYQSGSDAPLQPGCNPRPKPDIAAFKAIVADFTKLKVDLSKGELGGTPISTDGMPLGVHPGLGNANTSTAVRDRIKQVLSKHLAEGTLVAMAVMGLPNGFEPWIFLAMQLDPDTGNYKPVPSPSVMQPLDALKNKEVSKLLFSQMLNFAGGEKVVPAPANNNQNPITCQFYFVPQDKRKGVSTQELFELNPSPARVRPVVDVIADPVKSHFFNTDCVSCHTETHREIEILGTSSFAGIDDSMLPVSDWNVRNFGWFKSNFVNKPVAATVTRRTATETHEALSCINDLDACFARVP